MGEDREPTGTDRLKVTTPDQDLTPRRFALITCAVLIRECYHCASLSKNIIDVRSLEQGLHDIGEAKMSARLQEEIDAVDHEKYDTILLGYGLCNNGIRGLRSSVPLVIPRAHDCITLLIGSKEKYQEYFNQNPGTFYQSVGWIERLCSPLSNPDSTVALMGMSTREDYVAKYGEENAKYIMETVGDWRKNYSKLAYIDTGVGDTETCKESAKSEARECSWEYEEVRGDMAILQRLVDGQWDKEDFLVVVPGDTVQPSLDDEVIRAQASAP